MSKKEKAERIDFKISVSKKNIDFYKHVKGMNNASEYIWRLVEKDIKGGPSEESLSETLKRIESKIDALQVSGMIVSQEQEAREIIEATDEDVMNIFDI